VDNKPPTSAEKRRHTSRRKLVKNERRAKMNFNREELKTIRSALETAIEDLENEVAIESMIKDYAQMELRKIAPLVIKIDAELEMNK
jgi:hypothetical protein